MMMTAIHPERIRSRSTVSVVVVALPLLALAVVVLLVLLVKLYGYKITHPHTTSDIDEARRRSVVSSRATVTGQVKEHLLPLLPEWTYNPRDAKFLGQPVDFIVFEGLSDDTVERVVFVEVKTGKSRLSTRERSLRDAIAEGRVDYEVVRLSGYADAEGPLPAVTRSISRST